MTFTREKGIKCSQSKSPIRLRETGCIWCLFRSCNSTKNYSLSVILEAAQQLKQKSFPAVSVCCSWGDSVHLRIWEKKLQKKQQAEDIPRLPRAAQREEMRFYRGRKSLQNQYLLWVKRPNTPKAIATLQVAHRSQQTHDNPVTNGLFDWRGMNLETSLQKVVGQETHQSQTPLFRRCFSPASKKKKRTLCLTNWKWRFHSRALDLQRMGQGSLLGGWQAHSIAPMEAGYEWKLFQGKMSAGISAELWKDATKLEQELKVSPCNPSMIQTKRGITSLCILHPLCHTLKTALSFNSELWCKQWCPCEDDAVPPFNPKRVDRPEISDERINRQRPEKVSNSS